MMAFFQRAKDFADKKSSPKANNLPLEIGWLLDSQHSTFLFDAPRPIGQDMGLPGERDHGSISPFATSALDRLFMVPCPYELRLRPIAAGQGKFTLLNNADQKRTVSARRLPQTAVLVEQDMWRHPKRPVVQIATPYRLVADETVWLTQFPPFYTLGQQSWPGQFVSGRFPLHIWPRMMSWAFEWHDPARELVLEAGQPWFYIGFETEDPTRPIKIVEAEMTEALRTYCKGLDGVVNYVSRTYSLFETARERRPKVLLKKVVRGGEN